MSAARYRDWAQLPPELLGSIAERLMTEDYIRFGAACTAWASVASPRDGLCLPLAPQMPWLLLIGDEGQRGESCTLVSLPDRRRRLIGPLPEMRGKSCIGSQDGWLALFDEWAEVSFLNVLTGSQIHLPSVTTIPDVNPVYNSDGSLSEYLYKVDNETFPYTMADFRRTSFKKAVFSPSPTAGSYAVMALFSVYNTPAFATAGGGKWILFTAGPSCSDIIYRDGKFLAVSYAGELWALDVAGPPELTFIAKGSGIQCAYYDIYLVDSSGDLLQVWRNFSDASGKTKTKTIKVMKFDSERATWVPLRSLGDNSLFLGLCYSISLSSREISELKPNCVYFTEILWDGEDDRDRLMTRDVGVFSLEDESFDRYEPPDPRFNWPPPLWIAPSLVKSDGSSKYDQ